MHTFNHFLQKRFLFKNLIASETKPYFTPEEATTYPTKKEISIYHRRRRPALLGFRKKQASLFKP